MPLISILQIFHYLYGVLLFFLLILGYILSGVLRLFVQIILRIFYGKVFSIAAWDCPLNVFLGFEDFESSHPVPVLKILGKKPPNLQKIQNTFLNRVLRFKSNLKSNGERSEEDYAPFDIFHFRYVKKFLFFCWQRDPDFDVKNHIFIEYFDPSETYDKCEFSSLLDFKIAQACEYYAQVKFSPSRPQWEIRILAPRPAPAAVIHDDHKRDEFKFGWEDEVINYAFLLPVNHAYMDAVSFFHMLRYCFADAPFEMTLDPLKTPKRSSQKWSKCDYLKMTIHLITMPHQFALYVVEKYREIKKPHALFTRAKKTKRSCRWIQLDLQKLKEINVNNGSENQKPARLNAVLLCAISNAFSSVFSAFKDNFPTKFKLVLLTALLPYRTLQSLNKFTLGSVTLPLVPIQDSVAAKKAPHLNAAVTLQKDLNANAEKKIVKTDFAEMEKEIDKSTNKYQLVVSNLFFSTLGSLIYPWLGIYMKANLMSRFLLVSNIIGTNEKITVFGGDLVQEIIVFSPALGCLYTSISTCNYNGSLCIAMMADQSVLDKYPGLPGKCLGLIKTELEAMSLNNNVLKISK